jgi:hypothetical protein
MGRTTVRIAQAVGVGVLQIIGLNVVVFIVSLLLPGVGPDSNKGPFIVLAGTGFSVGIVAVGLGAVRFGWLTGGPALFRRIGLTVIGVFVPLFVALFGGQVYQGSPYFLISMVLGIIGFQAGGWFSPVADGAAR